MHSTSATKLSASLLQVVNGLFYIDSNSAMTRIDLPSLTSVQGDFSLANSGVSSIDVTALAFVGTALIVAANPTLTRFDVPSLSIVGGYLNFNTNAMLTLASLPKLTYINDRLLFCANNPAFMIPSGPPNAPAGGLVVSGANKNRPACFLFQGAQPCTGTENCP